MSERDELPENVHLKPQLEIQILLQNAIIGGFVKRAVMRASTLQELVYWVVRELRIGPYFQALFVDGIHSNSAHGGYFMR